MKSYLTSVTKLADLPRDEQNDETRQVGFDNSWKLANHAEKRLNKSQMPAIATVAWAARFGFAACVGVIGDL